MNAINLLIKPASGYCNMRCRYCFYHDEGNNRSRNNTMIMTGDTAGKLIASALEAASDAGVTFAFQGGEPTLAGLDFFVFFTQEVKRQNKKNVPVSYAIQTNGLELDENWVKLFLDNHFLVGISTDGSMALHDELRPDNKGNGTWKRVTDNLKMLLDAGVDVNLLCVVSRQCADDPEGVYRNLRNLGVRYLQFIPCLDPIKEKRGSMDYSLLPSQYGDFLCRTFDLWYRDWIYGDYTSIRLFEDYVHLLMGLPSSTCATSGSCGSYLVVEGDGTAYPCDFYCLDEWELGNINTSGVDELLGAVKEKEFLEEGLNIPEPCLECEYRAICSGGCKRDWEILEDGTKVNYFCESFKALFKHALPGMKEIALEEMRYMT
jgi:uncharacterized protein